MTEPIAITPCVNLTAFETFDKENLILYLNDQEIFRNTSLIPYPYTERDADTWLGLVEDSLSKTGTILNWAVRHREGGLVGGISRLAKSGPDGHFDEIGYWLAAPYRGQGLMTEVVSVYSDWLFSNTSLERIEAWVFSFNAASIKVLSKAGFEHEGLARKRINKDGVLIDAVLMAKIKN